MNDTQKSYKFNITPIDNIGNIIKLEEVNPRMILKKVIKGSVQNSACCTDGVADPVKINEFFNDLIVMKIIELADARLRPVVHAEDVFKTKTDNQLIIVNAEPSSIPAEFKDRVYYSNFVKPGEAIRLVPKNKISSFYYSSQSHVPEPETSQRIFTLKYEFDIESMYIETVNI